MFETKREVFAKYTDEATFSRIVEMDSVSQMWKKCLEQYYALPAIDYEGKQYTYAEVESDAALLRGLLKNNNIAKGDVVALLASNSYDFVKAYIAAVTYGCCVAILPAHLDEMSILGCCMQFQAKAVFFMNALEEKTSLAKSKLANVKFLPITQNGLTEKVALTDVAASDKCVIMFTGGTTGKSKGALLSNGAIMQGVVNGCYGIKEIFNQKYLLVLPLSHIFGLVRNFLTALYTGSTMRICTNNKDLFKDIAMFQPTILVLVPALVELGLNLSKQFGKNMFGTVKTIICGAAAVSSYLVQECDKNGIALLGGYGLTETANLVSGNPESIKYPDSVGIPYPNQEFKIVDGELWIKGKNMMDRYVMVSEEENANAYSDGWFKTGDLVRFDENGFLYITGRTKEIIVLSNGENVSPAEVEVYYNKISVIQDCQLYEASDENGKSYLALEIVPRAAELKRLGIEDAEKYILEEVEKVSQTLPEFQRPLKVIIRDTDFARSPAMKIIRYKK